MDISQRSAMVFAAGLGTRMQPLTANCPKPLLKVGQRTFLQRAIDHIDQAGISNIVVNAFYFPEQIQQALSSRPDIHVSLETQRLETGGGAKKALPLLGNEAFFTLNGDVVWETNCLLKQLHDVWNDEHMDALLLLIPTELAEGSVGRGDFVMNSRGQLERYRDQSEVSYVYTGCQLISPRLFDGTPEIFSMNVLYNEAIESGRLYGKILQGEWFHLSTPDDLQKWAPFIEEQEREWQVSGGHL